MWLRESGFFVDAWPVAVFVMEGWMLTFVCMVETVDDSITMET